MGNVNEEVAEDLYSKICSEDEGDKAGSDVYPSSPATSASGVPLTSRGSSPYNEKSNSEVILFKKYILYVGKQKSSPNRNQNEEKNLGTNYQFCLPERYEGPFVHLGKGAYGSVISCFDSETKKGVAVKIMRVKRFSNDLLMKSQKLEKMERRYNKCILRELMILRHFKDSENVLGLVDVIAMNSENEEETNCQNFTHLYFITDLLDCDLTDLMRNASLPLEEEEFKKILYYTFKGLRLIHRSNICHRDLKSQNILYTSQLSEESEETNTEESEEDEGEEKRNKQDNIIVKICDFGLSRGMNFNSVHSVTGNKLVTINYRSPELIMRWEKANRETDLWSAGCVMAEFCAGSRGGVFFRTRGQKKMLEMNLLEEIIRIRGSPDENELLGIESAKEKVRKLPTQNKKSLEKIFARRGRRLTPECLDLLDRLLTFDPRKRINIEEVLLHDWFQKIREKDIMNSKEEEEIEEFVTRVSEDLTIDEIRKEMFEVVTDWRENSKYYKRTWIVQKDVIELY